MVFSSLVFLFAFLPCVVGLYYICRNRIWRNTVLLLASLLFYSWGEPRALLLLLAVALAAYLGALLTDRFRLSRPCLAQAAYLVTLVLILLNLFWFKYLNFTAANLERLLGRPLGLPAVTLPIGISFYTFQTLSYVIDLRRGRIRVQRNFFWLLLYISLFPQLIAGPIVRYQTVEDEIRCRRESTAELWEGLKRFIRGLAKKVLLANQVALICEAVFGGSPSVYGTAACWLATLAFGMQIYFDFSGYSDMAIGLGRMFGFHFLENFEHPYASLSVTEFWRRWHISLSSWFRDYVYIPLGGSRVSRLRWVLNVLIVWTLTGFWHGAEWNFILWGLYFALLLVLEKLVWGKVLARLPKALRWLYSFALVTISWILFYHSEPGALLPMLARMFRYCPTLWPEAAADLRLLLGLPFLALALPLCFPLAGKRRCGEGLSAAWHLLLLGLCVLFILSSRFNPFLYFRF